MSAWGEMRRRSAGKQSRKEDFFPCNVKPFINGKGAKFPKSLAVSDDVRYERLYIMLHDCDGNYIDSQNFVWAYIVGHKNFCDLLSEYIYFRFIYSACSAVRNAFWGGSK